VSSQKAHNLKRTPSDYTQCSKCKYSGNYACRAIGRQKNNRFVHMINSTQPLTSCYIASQV